MCHSSKFWDTCLLKEEQQHYYFKFCSMYSCGCLYHLTKVFSNISKAHGHIRSISLSGECWCTVSSGFLKFRWIINKKETGKKKRKTLGSWSRWNYPSAMTNPIGQLIYIFSFFLLNNINENCLYVFSRLSCQASSKG